MSKCIHCENEVSGDESCWSCLRILERSVKDSQSLEATRIENATAKFEWTLAVSIFNRESSLGRVDEKRHVIDRECICTKLGKK